MISYKFRVLLDTDEDVFRDIEVSENHTFLQLHNCILEAFGFSGGEMASFYLSNEDWDKGEEIALMDMMEGGADMASTSIADKVESADQKFVYVYDFLRMWCFYIDLIEESNNKVDAPSVVLSYGDAPEETSKEIADIREDAFSSQDAGLGDLGEGIADDKEFGDTFGEEPFESTEGLEGLDEYY